METLNRSFEPMDIDLSSSITENMDISGIHSDGDWENSYVNCLDETPTFGKLPPVEQVSINKQSRIKKYHINLQRDVKDCSYKSIKVVSVVIILGLAIIVPQVLNLRCGEDINIDQLKLELVQKVYGQSKAIDAIIDVLKIKKSKLLIFYGGTGVGKTYAASLIMDSFGCFPNLFHSTMSSFDNYSILFLISLTVCKNSMLIIDDLSKDNTDIVKSVNNIILRSKDMENNMTVILIYNCMKTVEGFDQDCDKYFNQHLVKNFESIIEMKKSIKFEQLHEEHLKKCIENEIGHEVRNTNDLRNVYKYFNVATDGCKGVHAKMKLYKDIN